MIGSMLKKELLDAFRDKRTMLLTFFVPVVMLTALVFFYEGLMSEDPNETSTVAVSHELTEEGERFFADLPYLKPEVMDHPKQAVEDGNATFAFLVEESFFTKINQGEATDVTLYGDATSEKASHAMTKMENKLNNIEDQIVSQRLTDQNLNATFLEAIHIHREAVSYNEGSSTSTMVLAIFLPMIFAISIASGALPISADLLAGEKEKRTMESLLMTPVSRKKMLISKWITVTTIGFLSGITAFIIVVLETLLFTEQLKEALAFGDQLPFVIAILLLTTLLFSAFIGSLQLLVSLISKTVKEFNNYASPVIMVSVLPVFLVMNKGANEFGFSDYMMPFKNIYVLLKEMLLGVMDVTGIALTLGSTFVYMLIAFFIAQILFLKDKWVLQK